MKNLVMILVAFGIFLGCGGSEKTQHPVMGVNLSDICLPVTIDTDSMLAPPKMEFPSMVEDPVRQQVVMFGGFTSGGAYNANTYAFTDAGWSQLAAAGPSARSAGMLVFDAPRQQIVLFGGKDGSSSKSDTWGLGPDLNLVGSPQSVWKPITTSSAPPARHGAASVFRGSSGSVVTFGGFDGTSYLNDTWSWNGTTWTANVPSTVPPARAHAAIAYDPVAAVVVMFGGKTAASQLNDHWVYDGSDWTLVSSGARPSARWGSAMAWMPALNKMVMFGGHDGTNYLNETWLLSGSTWKRLNVGLTPSKRLGHAMTNYARIQSILLYGGRDTAGNSLGDTWEFNGSRWLLAQTPAN